MSYTTATTALADATLISKVNLAIRKIAYTRIDKVANGEDQRELAVCKQLFANILPEAWSILVILALDDSGALTAPSDDQIDSAVNVTWDKIKLVG